MSTNEWHQWQAPGRQQPERRPYHQHYASEPAVQRPRVQEDTLREMFVQIERKTFAIALKENVRGRFLRITEEAGTKYTTIILPATGLEDLLTVIIEMVKADKENPAQSAPGTPTNPPA